MASTESEDANFVSLWALLGQVGDAEVSYPEQAASYLISCIDSDPIGVTHICERDDSGRIFSASLDARLHLLQQLSIFASQGTLLDSDDRPNDKAQGIFERVGFYSSDIYPYLVRNDVAFSLGDERGTRFFPDGRHVAGWILGYDGLAWISQRRVAKILIESMCNAEITPQHYDEEFLKWFAALSDSIERGDIAVQMSSGKKMLAHADVLDWCVQNGYVWPLDANEVDLTPEVTLSSRIDEVAYASRGIHAHQEQQILHLLRAQGYEPTKLPKTAPGKKGVKLEIRDILKWQGKRFDKAWERVRKSGDKADA